jgi:hypothetical protein
MLLAGLTFGATLLAFTLNTAAVRIANVDDALFQNIVSARSQREVLSGIQPPTKGGFTIYCQSGT